MRKNILHMFLIFGLAVFICLSQNFGVTAQTEETLKLNRETKFVLKNKEEKVLFLNLKKDDFTEIDWKDSLDRYPKFTIISPGGRDLSKEINSEGPMIFIASEDGKYKITIRLEETENVKDGQFNISYKNTFKLPNSAKLVRQRKVNGYDIEVYNTSEDESSTYLLIKKDGKLKEILEGGSLVGGGFNFSDEAAKDDSAEAKKSAMLMKTTVDKTGDGTPDIAVGFFSGGAHCCFDLHFYELGKDNLKKLPVISGQDSDVLAIGKQPNGSLILRTGDSTFGYWLTSFAGSPIPSVILTYQNGEFRADAKLMKKPAPSAVILKQRAAKAKKEIDLKPYTGEEDSSFLNAFWGEMLDLIYSGNETAAWQYFDTVWDSRKQGKAKFKSDFLKRLNDSEYWQQLQGK